MAARLEIRSAFGGKETTPDEVDCDYVVACVYGDGNESIEIDTHHSFKIVKHLNRLTDRTACSCPR